MSASAAAQEWGVFSALWRRDMLRLKRERSRWAGVVLQPLMFWFIIGSGMADVFHIEGVNKVSYLRYFFPGILVMIVLFTAIFATISIIEDRQTGFLQSVLVAPGSRAAMVLGKIAGVISLALIQAGIFVALAPFAGYSYGEIHWVQLFLSVVLMCGGLTAIGIAMAWILDSAQAYHALMSVLLLPLWIMSGAMFPTREESWVDWVMTCNPMTYGVATAREAMSGIPSSRDPDLMLSFGVLVGFMILATSLAVWVAQKAR